MSRAQQRRRIAGAAVVLTLVTAFLFWPTEPVTWSLPTPTASIEKDAVTPQKPLEVTPTISNPESKITKAPAKLPTDLPPLPELEATRWQDSVSPTSVAAVPSSTPAKECIKYEQLQRLKQKPWSEGWRQFPYSRPSPECRTFKLPAMEELIEKMRGVVKDPDLFRLFENSYPNTLDTMIKWRGYAESIDVETGNATTTDEELTYVITGDVRLSSIGVLSLHSAL